MALAASAWDVQRCTICRSCSPVCCSSSSSSLELSAIPARGLPRLTLRKRHRQKQLIIIRSLYSSLVESFGSTQPTLSYGLHGSFGNPRDSSPASSQQQGQNLVASEIERKSREDPVAYVDGDHAETLVDYGRNNVDMKRSARARPPSMSISQGFSSHVRRSMSQSVAAVGHPLNAVKLPGPMAFVMALAVAALGLRTAVAKQGLLPGTPQKVCEKCEGYGVQECHVCQGRGVLSWEGKLLHTNDPCPLCFGSCLKKCSDCGGVKTRKGMPPAMVSKIRLKAGSIRK